MCTCSSRRFEITCLGLGPTRTSILSPGNWWRAQQAGNKPLAPPTRSTTEEAAVGTRMVSAKQYAERHRALVHTD
jgi:hypothetical protein